MWSEEIMALNILQGTLTGYKTKNSQFNTNLSIRPS